MALPLDTSRNNLATIWQNMAAHSYWEAGLARQNMERYERLDHPFRGDRYISMLQMQNHMQDAEFYAATARLLMGVE